METVQEVENSVSLCPSFKKAMYEPFQDQCILRNGSFTPNPSSQTNLDPWANNLRQLLVAVAILAIPFVFNYLFTLSLYHWTHNRRKTGQIPPQYPAMPFIGCTIPFLWDSASFVKKAT